MQDVDVPVRLLSRVPPVDRDQLVECQQVLACVGNTEDYEWLGREFLVHLRNKGPLRRLIVHCPSVLETELEETRVQRLPLLVLPESLVLEGVV